MSQSKFADLGLPPVLLHTVEQLGYDTPTPVQEATIPALLSGRDLMGVARTGTGKTAAFGLPLVAAITSSKRAVQALVLTPTRELAQQVAAAIESMAAGTPDLQVVAVYGGAPYLPQRRALINGAQVVVGTPGRIIDHIERGSLDLTHIKYAVLDEADEMLQMGFTEDVDRILHAIPGKHQTALFSATMPSSIRRVADTHLHDPIRIDIAGSSSPTTLVHQRYAVVPHRAKTSALRRVMAVNSALATIVFVRTREAAQQVGSELIEHGVAAAYLSGDVAQNERERIVERLRSGALDVLVATDVAARGLDVERIGLVVNFDLPNEPEVYVHRIGRTGRAGRTGDAITFVTPGEVARLRRMEKALKLNLEAMDVPNARAVAAHAAQQLLNSANEETPSARLNQFQELVSTYLESSEHSAAEMLARVIVVAASGIDREDSELDGILSAARRHTNESSDTSRRSGRSSDGSATVYRVAVGHRDGVGPGALVGALTGEGGLSADAIGKIRMFGAFSLVDIPGGLGEPVIERLSRTQIAGRRLQMRVDSGRPGEDSRRRSGEDPRRRSHDDARGRRSSGPRPYRSR